MTDARIAAPGAAAGGGGLLGFLGEALGSLRNHALIVPTIVLVLFLTVTNIVLATNIPTTRPQLLLFGALALVRVAGILVLAVAILRLINRSPRPTWMPDGSFWLYGLTFLFGVGVSLALTRLVGGRSDPLSGMLIGSGVSLLTAPFAAWFVAIAVEQPLAWRAGRWLRDFGRWLPHLILWSLLLIVPLGQLHATIDARLVAGAGRWFWPLALVDGPLSAVLALLSLTLASTAYRSVARG